MGSDVSRSGAMFLTPTRAYTVASRHCNGEMRRILPTLNVLPRYCAERQEGKRLFHTRLYKRKKNNDGNDNDNDNDNKKNTADSGDSNEEIVGKEIDDSKQDKAKKTRRATMATKNRREYNPISDFLYGANYVHSQYLSILWRYSIVRSFAVTLPIGIAVCFDEKYGLCDALFRGLRSVFVVSAAAARLLQLPLEVAQSLLLNIWNVSPEAMTTAIDFLPNAAAIPAVRLALSVRAAVTTIVEFGCGNDAITFLSSVMAILFWRPAVEEWQYRSALDKLLFGVPHWVLTRSRRRKQEEPSASTTIASISRANENAASGDNDSGAVSVDNDETQSHRSALNKLLFGAPRFVLKRSRRRKQEEPSPSTTIAVASRVNENVANGDNGIDTVIVEDDDGNEDVEDDSDVDDETQSPSESGSSLPTEEAVPSFDQSIGVDVNNVDTTKNRSVVNKLLFGAPQWVLAQRRRRKQELSASTNIIKDVDIVNDATLVDDETHSSLESESLSKSGSESELLLPTEEDTPLFNQSMISNENEVDSTKNRSVEDDVDGDDKTQSPSESESSLPIEEAVPSCNQSIGVDANNVDTTKNRSVVNKLLFGAPRWVLAQRRRQKQELSASTNIIKDVGIVNDATLVDDEASSMFESESVSESESKSLLSTEEAAPLSTQSMVSDENEVDPTKKRSVVNKLMFGVPRWVWARRRKSPSTNVAKEDDVIDNTRQSSSSGTTSKSSVPIEVKSFPISDQSMVVDENDMDSTKDGNDNDDDDEKVYTPFLPDESTRILLGSLLFATTRLGWLTSDPADTVVDLSNSPYGFTIGFLQSIFSLLSSGRATVPEVRHGLRIFILLLAIHQTVSSFLVAQHVFAGIYRRRGLAASVGAHVSWTVGKGTIVFRLFLKVWRWSTGCVWRRNRENSPDQQPGTIAVDSNE